MAQVILQRARCPPRHDTAVREDPPARRDFLRLAISWGPKLGPSAARRARINCASTALSAGGAPEDDSPSAKPSTSGQQKAENVQGTPQATLFVRLGANLCAGPRSTMRPPSPCTPMASTMSTASVPHLYPPHGMSLPAKNNPCSCIFMQTSIIPARHPINHEPSHAHVQYLICSHLYVCVHTYTCHTRPMPIMTLCNIRAHHALHIGAVSHIGGYCFILVNTPKCERPKTLPSLDQALCSTVLIFGVANRVLYRMALVPMRDYVFFLAQVGRWRGHSRWLLVGIYDFPPLVTYIDGHSLSLTAAKRRIPHSVLLAVVHEGQVRQRQWYI